MGHVQHTCHIASQALLVAGVQQETIGDPQLRNRHFLRMHALSGLPLRWNACSPTAVAERGGIRAVVVPLATASLYDSLWC